MLFLGYGIDVLTSIHCQTLSLKDSGPSLGSIPGKLESGPGGPDYFIHLQKSTSSYWHNFSAKIQGILCLQKSSLGPKSYLGWFLSVGPLNYNKQTKKWLTCVGIIALLIKYCFSCMVLKFNSQTLPNIFPEGFWIILGVQTR